MCALKSTLKCFSKDIAALGSSRPPQPDIPGEPQIVIRLTIRSPIVSIYAISYTMRPSLCPTLARLLTPLHTPRAILQMRHCSSRASSPRLARLASSPAHLPSFQIARPLSTATFVSIPALRPPATLLRGVLTMLGQVRGMKVRSSVKRFCDGCSVVRR